MRKPKSSPNTITAGSLAELTGLTERRINQLADEQKILRDESGQFPTAETLKRLFAYFRQDGQGSSEYEREKLLLLAARRKLSEAELKEKDELWMLRADHHAAMLMIARTGWPQIRRHVEDTLPRTLDAQCRELSISDDHRQTLVSTVIARGVQFVDEFETLAEKLGNPQPAAK